MCAYNIDILLCICLRFLMPISRPLHTAFCYLYQQKYSYFSLIDAMDCETKSVSEIIKDYASVRNSCKTFLIIMFFLFPGNLFI